AAREAERPRQTLSLAANRLQREVVVFHRDVVLELVERETRAAAAAQIEHLQLARGPDALDVLDVRVHQPPDGLVLDDVFDAGERVVVLADPDDGSRVLRRLRFLWLR